MSSDSSDSNISPNLNPYGDRFNVKSELYGSDISSQRRDDLDIACAQHALMLLQRSIEKQIAPPCGIDLGSGLGTPSIGLAVFGVHMLLVDLLDLDERFDMLRQQLPVTGMEYLQKNIRQLLPNDLPERIDFAYSQRYVHFLRFDEAVTLIKLIGTRMKKGSHLFLSASGLNSELREGYPHANNAVRQRFSRLARPMSKKHGILEKVCLYISDDLTELALCAGFEAKHVYSSRFGNVKGIFYKT